jgi:hypothetical protein
VEADGADRPQQTGPEHSPKPPPIYIQDAITIPFSSRCWNKSHPEPMKPKPLPKTRLKFNRKRLTHTEQLSKPWPTNTEFHTYKPKEERNYRVVLKHLHCSIDPADIKAEIENLGHKVANIWNIK